MPHDNIVGEFEAKAKKFKEDYSNNICLIKSALSKALDLMRRETYVSYNKPYEDRFATDDFNRDKLNAVRDNIGNTLKTLTVPDVDNALEEVNSKFIEAIEEVSSKRTVKKVNDDRNDFWGLMQTRRDIVKIKVDVQEVADKYNSWNKTIVLVGEFAEYLEKLSILIEEMQSKSDSCTPALIQFRDKVDGSMYDYINQIIYGSLSTEGKLSLDNKLLISVEDSIASIKKTLQTEPGVWRNLHPIIKGILGVIAALTIIPALIIQATTTKGFKGTFFVTPDTISTTAFKDKELDITPGVNPPPNKK